MASQSDQFLAEVDGVLRSTLVDKSSRHSFTDQLTQMAQNDYLLNSRHEALGSTGKKKCEVTRRRNDLETNKRKKARKGQSDETEGGPGGELNVTPGSIQTESRNTSNQFIPDQLMQGHYVLGHNFGLGISQNLHDNLNQFGQEGSVSTLPQQPFPGNAQLTQVARLLAAGAPTSLSVARSPFSFFVVLLCGDLPSGCHPEAATQSRACVWPLVPPLPFAAAWVAEHHHAMTIDKHVVWCLLK
nr:unnamed protein product [Digitaria exilis]